VRLHPDLERDIDRLFRAIPPLPDRIEAAYAVFGLGPASSDPSDRKATLDANEPLPSRLKQYETDLRRGLHLCAEQIDEFEPTHPYVAELQGQGMATLIALRELYRHFPEVFD